jgi:hypothetical protein
LTRFVGKNHAKASIRRKTFLPTPEGIAYCAKAKTNFVAADLVRVARRGETLADPWQGNMVIASKALPLTVLLVNRIRTNYNKPQFDLESC